MYGIGKAIVFKVLHNGYVLKTIGDLQSNFADVLAEATAFVAPCYGCKEDGQMSDIRYSIWLSKTRKAAFAPKLKSLPPTSEAFMENIKRAHLQACIWKSALYPNSPHVGPTDFGWSKDEANKVLIPITFQGH